MSKRKKTQAAELLLGWYDRHRRHLPWRSAPGETPDPYHVWLSEIMLQQTAVATVGPSFKKFLKRWPTVDGLAAAELDQVLQAWAGLGYYARARNLHKCAVVVSRDYGGQFPESEAKLLELPGIGRYTAAAVAAIAFGHRSVVMDGNVERVMARIFKVLEPLPGSKPILYEHAAELTPMVRAGDYAQAVMDLGATICTVRKPKCMHCPLESLCDGEKIAGVLPRRQPRPEKPTRRGIAIWLVRDDGAVLLRRRLENGLLGGMMEIPGTEWAEGDWPSTDDAFKVAPIASSPLQMLGGHIRHTFTHFHLELRVAIACSNQAAPKGCLWCLPNSFGDHALPSVMKKAIAHAIRKSSVGIS
ncbi:MAG: A/G-specific adenine glycosylase [Rhodospirillaceae bacterium]|nr:A/G-specific adenine glycosylase [Rhodospirillaceae bacterium]